jgi:hypothetical protein
MRFPPFALIPLGGLLLLCPIAILPSALGQNPNASSPAKLSDDELRTQLVGSWRIVSASFGGVPSELHKNSITIKHITPVHLIWIGYQPDDRRIFRSSMASTSRPCAMGSMRSSSKISSARISLSIAGSKGICGSKARSCPMDRR